MTQGEILKEIDRILDTVVKIDQTDYIHDPYQEKLFDLCREAHLKGYFKDDASPRLYADYIASVFNEKWANLDPEHPKRKLFNRDLYRVWDEWEYVLEKINYHE